MRRVAVCALLEDHGVEMGKSTEQPVAFPIARKVLPRPVYLWAKDLRNAWRVRRDPSRILLVKEILPAYAALGGRILWVGCRRYTREYGPLLKRYGGELWTIDIEIAHASWGERGRHFTWDLLEIDRLVAAGSFDSVLCNGVFGFGVDTRESQLAALQAMGAILKPGGRLLLGWNTDRVEDPMTLEFVRDAFAGDAPTGQGARIAVPESAYVYDFLRRRQS